MNMQAAEISSKKREEYFSFHTSFNYYAPLGTLDTAGEDILSLEMRRRRANPECKITGKMTRNPPLRPSVLHYSFIISHGYLSPCANFGQPGRRGGERALESTCAVVICLVSTRECCPIMSRRWIGKYEYRKSVTKWTLGGAESSMMWKNGERGGGNFFTVKAPVDS